MIIGDYSINYHFIGDYQRLFYWWFLVIILLVIIGDYSIDDYR